MEPTKTPSGRKGSLANPEVYENVPGHIIPRIAREFDDFDNEAAKFLDGKTPENEFIGFRLKQGVYGQRQPGVQMVRVKLPWGGVTPDQMDAFASVIEKYAPLNKGHITTRQCIQMHHIPLDIMAKLIREISDANLSSREGCGNTVRNVTGDPWAGLLSGETFDTTPYAGAYVRYFVRHPTTQLMPRKVKTAFEGTPEIDRSITGIHDIAFLAKVREDGTRGFEVRVGGGTSIMPRIAPSLYDFVEADNGDYLKIAEAVFRIYDRQDWLRPNRARARLKVFVDKFGIDELRAQVEEELKGDWVDERDFSIDAIRFDVDEEGIVESAPDAGTTYGSPNGDLSDFNRFCESNVAAQKQDGFSAVEIKVFRGDLTPEQFRGLGQIMREYSHGLARTTIGQNLVLRWVRNEALYDVWQRLKALDLGDAGAREITDNVSCPGTDSCKLGITSSMGLNKAINEKLLEMDITDPLTRKVHIKNSGCPNGCGQHHIGDLGFYGASIKVGEHTIPAYIPHVGGVYEGEGGAVAFGDRLKLRLPAKRVPEAIERWLRMYEAERTEGETFKQYATRVGTVRFEEEVKGDLALADEFSLETMNTFIDWDRDVPFQVIRGEGECAV
ncbi:MAG: nitrite/sulfite reductase [Baekduia sp.]